MNFSFFLILIYCSFQFSFGSNRKQFLSDLGALLNDPTRYDRNLFAPTENGSAIRVSVNAHVRDIRDVSEVTMTYRVEIYFSQTWNDPRLIIDEKYANITFTSLNSDYVDKIWRPDTYFSNTLESIAPPKDDDSFTHKNLLMISGNGVVWFSQRLSLTASCSMKLKNYPFDFQMCRLSFESYGIEKKFMEYKWLNQNSVTIADVKLPDFILINVSTAETVSMFDEAAYSCLRLCFLFERKSAFYFMELYNPAILIVIAAWLATVGKKSTFSDILQVLLAQLFLYFSYITVMPRVSDVKAMDIFLAGCFAFIFLALLQTFIKEEENVYAISKNNKRDSSTNTELISHIQEKSKDSSEDKKVFRKRKIQKASLTGTKNICKYLTWRNFFLYAMYPIAFALFCFFYFVTYKFILQDNYKIEKC